MTSTMASAPPQGAPLSVLRVRVAEQVEADDALPTQLSTIARYRGEEAVNRERPRVFTLIQPQNRWEINGRVPLRPLRRSGLRCVVLQLGIKCFAHREQEVINVKRLGNDPDLLRQQEALDLLHRLRRRCTDNRRNG
jgi:hypothetical protein